LRGRDPPDEGTERLTAWEGLKSGGGSQARAHKISVEALPGRNWSRGADWLMIRGPVREISTEWPITLSRGELLGGTEGGRVKGGFLG